MHKGVIGGDACLARVEEFAPGDAFGGLGDVGAVGHDGGAFAAKLEGYGGEVFGCGGHDAFADGGAAGEEDVAEGV